MRETINTITEDDTAGLALIRDAKAVDNFLSRLDQEIQREFSDNG